MTEKDIMIKMLNRNIKARKEFIKQNSDNKELCKKLSKLIFKDEIRKINIYRRG